MRTAEKPWLSSTAYAVVIGSWLALVLFFGWCYAAASRGSTRTAEGKTPHLV